MPTTKKPPMDSELFLESCRHDDEQELQRASYLPSLSEIAVVKRRIRDEKKAKEALEGSPHDVRRFRQPRIIRTNHNGQRRKRLSSVD
jgi:hypothetical protein